MFLWHFPGAFFRPYLAVTCQVFFRFFRTVEWGKTSFFRKLHRFWVRKFRFGLPKTALSSCHFCLENHKKLPIV